MVRWVSSVPGVLACVLITVNTSLVTFVLMAGFVFMSPTTPDGAWVGEGPSPALTAPVVCVCVCMWRWWWREV